MTFENALCFLDSYSTETMTATGEGHAESAGTIPDSFRRPAVTIHPPNSANSLPNSNRFSALIPDQSIAIVSEFTLESGTRLEDVPVAFRTWGKLNSTYALPSANNAPALTATTPSHSHDNVMIICHALTGSSDVEDW